MCVYIYIYLYIYKEYMKMVCILNISRGMHIFEIVPKLFQEQQKRFKDSSLVSVHRIRRASKGAFVCSRPGLPKPYHLKPETLDPP